MAQKQLKVFFDLDGTLIDVSRRHYKVYSEITESLGGKPIQKETYWMLKRSKTAWSEILKTSQLSPNMTDNFLRSFIEKIEQPEHLKLDVLLPSAVTVLKETAKTNQCYLVSLRRNMPNLMYEVNLLGIRQYFTKVLSAHSDSDGSDKKTELIQSELKQDEKGVIIGDTEADIKTGKALGLMTIAVLSGIRDEQFLAKLEPDYIITDTSKLRNLEII